MKGLSLLFKFSIGVFLAVLLSLLLVSKAFSSPSPAEETNKGDSLSFYMKVNIAHHQIVNTARSKKTPDAFPLLSKQGLAKVSSN